MSKVGEVSRVSKVSRISDRWWIVVYAVVAAGSLVAYFLTKGFLIFTSLANFVVSNLTLNLILFVMAWGAAGPYLFRKQSFIIRWTLVLVGFVLIIVLLTITGTHTRLTDIIGVFKK